VVARFSAPVQIGPGAHPVQQVLGLYPGGKTAGAWRWPPNPIRRRG